MAPFEKSPVRLITIWKKVDGVLFLILICLFGHIYNFFLDPNLTCLIKVKLRRYLSNDIFGNYIFEHYPLT